MRAAIGLAAIRAAMVMGLCCVGMMVPMPYITLILTVMRIVPCDSTFGRRRRLACERIRNGRERQALSHAYPVRRMKRQRYGEHDEKQESSELLHDVPILLQDFAGDQVETTRLPRSRSGLRFFEGICMCDLVMVRAELTHTAL